MKKLASIVSAVLMILILVGLALFLTRLLGLWPDWMIEAWMVWTH